MIKVLTGKERADSWALFEQLFRLRHDIFIKQRNWSIPSRLDGREIDEYDVDEAVYLFDLDDLGRIVASVRLTPTECCSLLADCFPHLIENGQSPRGPDIYEGMRFIFAPTLPRDEARQARIRILYAMVRWCIDHNIAWIQGITDVEYFRSFVDITIRTTPLGLAHPYAGGKTAPGGGECIAFRWPASRDVLDDLCTYARRERQFAISFTH